LSDSLVKIPDHPITIEPNASIGGKRSVSESWTPHHAAVVEIRDYLAFCPDRVDAIDQHDA